METAKFCGQCGQPLPPDAKHCPNCGAEVAPDVVPPSPASAEPQGPQTMGAGPFGVQAMPPPPEPPSPSPGSGPFGAPAAPAGPGPYAAGGPYAGTPQAARPARARRLGGGFLGVLGGIVMIAGQVNFMRQGSPLNAYNMGIGVLCLVSGVVSMLVRGWGPVLLGLLLNAAVFALCGTKLYQSLLWLQTQEAGAATAWTIQKGGIIWVVGMMLGMLSFAGAFRSLFRRR